MNQAFNSLFSEAGGTLATAELASNSREIMIYPNPTDGPVWFRAHAGLLGSRAVVAVYTVVGSRIMEKAFSSLQNASLDLSAVPKGLYFISVQVGDLRYQAKIIRK